MFSRGFFTFAIKVFLQTELPLKNCQVNIFYSILYAEESYTKELTL